MPPQAMWLFITGGASGGNNSLIALNTNGVTQINNTNTGGLTNGDGLSVGGEGISLAFPLDPTSSFGLGAITNLSTINGIAFPPTPAFPLAGIINNTAVQGTIWSSTGTVGQYKASFPLPGITLATGANVQVTMINTLQTMLVLTG